jgi:hypothetical protein
MAGAWIAAMMAASARSAPGFGPVGPGRVLEAHNDRIIMYIIYILYIYTILYVYYIYTILYVYYICILFIHLYTHLFTIITTI